MNHIWYSCRRCLQIRCLACEVAAPDSYRGEIKTAVRWCGSEACVEDEATANGISVDRMKAHKVRVQAAWRRDAKCVP